MPPLIRKSHLPDTMAIFLPLTSASLRSSAGPLQLSPLSSLSSISPSVWPSQAFATATFTHILLSSGLSASPFSSASSGHGGGAAAYWRAGAKFKVPPVATDKAVTELGMRLLLWVKLD